MSFSELIIIRENNKLYGLWKLLDVLCCLISSYFYAYMAAFQDPKRGDSLFILMVFFETVFAISIMLKFLVEYVKDGQTIPTRDLA